MNKKEIEILTNQEIPESIRQAIAQSILGTQISKEDRELEKQRLLLDRRKLFLNTPFVAALACLITLTATFLFDRITTTDAAHHLITIEQVKKEISESEARLKQQLLEKSKKTDAELEAIAQEREFQYEIVKSELADNTKDNIDRAAVLLFLARAGVLNQLNEKELRDMAKAQKENPQDNIIPKLSSMKSTPESQIRKPCADRNVLDFLTPELILAVVPSFSGVRADQQRALVQQITPHLKEGFALIGACDIYSISALMGQLSHESAGFQTMEEFASGAVYEGRRELGNIHEGDGRKFKGRGLLLLTGRRNYRELGKFLGIPLEEHPELVSSDPEIAVGAAIWYLKSRNILRACSDSGCDIVKLTRLINGGLNGLEDRRRYTMAFQLELAKAATRSNGTDVE